MQATVETAPVSEGQNTVDAKILSDLSTLTEKMDLCDTMLHPADGSPAPSVKENEVVLAIIGFLEACAPRMVELVEVAAQGALSEEALVMCLEVNDRLQKQLLDIDTVSLTETVATTTAASIPTAPAQSAAGLDAFDDLLLNSGDDSSLNAIEKDPFGSHTDILTSTPAAIGKSTDEHDFDPFAVKAAPTASPDTKPAAAFKDDAWDAFFADRTFWHNEYSKSVAV